MPKITPLFSLKNISFHVGPKQILTRISLDILPGEYIGIIGPNGGGKTTLLKVLLGLLQPTGGTMDVTIPRQKIGYVPQRFHSNDEMFPATVREIVQSGILGRVKRHEVDQRISHALKATGTSKLLHQRIGTLSGGERQRVMIARALASEPDALFLDEPTSAIDPASQEEFYGLLRTLHKKGLTVVIVSHDTDTIAHEVERVWCLNRHLVCHGAPEDVMHKVKMEHYGH